ncbi:conserved hypothetical integral membrane protein [Alteribacillus persepolensis]|uniref:Conserved hypothetical integral membrane protein n=1 Tax=Alteribacillus persepolensis TaxID=568899 RepID=A0A1G8HBP0_9BACI|nr:DUF1146 family protein [Alteribacillus persepolensis]SDI03901.1 conserved hypothetical integral membrane protein [Alteribacillus persepolensis]
MHPDGQEALLHIMVNLGCLVVVWWSLQTFRFDVFVRNPEGAKAKVLMVFVTIAISYLVSSFFLDYLEKSLMLRYLF